jgi:periplasmic copper chaperone A
MRRKNWIKTGVVLALSGVMSTGCGVPAPPPQSGASVGQAGTIIMSEPRVRLPAAGQDQTAAYLTLTNTGTKADRLISAKSPHAGKLELHAHTKTSDGMMMMRHLDYIEVPAGATIPLVPGGLHIMVKQVKRDLKVGQTLPLELTFASGVSANIIVPVVANPRSQTEGVSQDKQGHQH